MKKILRQQLALCVSSGETSEVELEVDTADGGAKLVVRKTIIEYYSPTEYEKVMDLYERLNRGGGRKLWTLEDMTK